MLLIMCVQGGTTATIMYTDMEIDSTGRSVIRDGQETHCLSSLSYRNIDSMAASIASSAKLGERSARVVAPANEGQRAPGLVV